MKRLHKAMTRIVGVLLMALMMVPSGLKAETTEMLQTSKITGVVTDDFGEPIIGVTVRVKNAQNGAVTDVNGRYSVNAPKNATLVFSFIGYRTQEVAVKGRTTVNVTLKEDSQMLEETVVIGYGAVCIFFKERRFAENKPCECESRFARQNGRCKCVPV